MEARTRVQTCAAKKARLNRLASTKRASRRASRQPCAFRQSRAFRQCSRGASPGEKVAPAACCC
eukprot:2828409-Pleurochrysis_carterae.AAC.1